MAARLLSDVGELKEKLQYEVAQKFCAVRSLVMDKLQTLSPLSSPRDQRRSQATDFVNGGGGAASNGGAAIANHDTADAARKAKIFKQKFRQTTSKEFRINATQLTTVWFHCDSDGNGFIEGDELDQFLKEFVSSVCESDVGEEVVSPAMLSELKVNFLDAYDDNDDGKIEIKELAQLLPTDENFLLIFQLENRLNSSVEFIRVWKKYDMDSNGYIEANELKYFLRDLLAQVHPNITFTADKLDEYTGTILEIFDENKDGRLQLSEMARLLPVKENAMQATLSKRFFSSAKSVTHQDIQDIFAAYDKNGSGQIDGEEISGLAKDLIELMQPSYTKDDIETFERMLMESCDLDGDGNISKEELTLLLFGLQRFYKH